MPSLLRCPRHTIPLLCRCNATDAPASRNTEDPPIAPTVGIIPQILCRDTTGCDALLSDPFHCNQKVRQATNAAMPCPPLWQASAAVSRLRSLQRMILVNVLLGRSMFQLASGSRCWGNHVQLPIPHNEVAHSLPISQPLGGTAADTGNHNPLPLRRRAGAQEIPDDGMCGLLPCSRWNRIQCPPPRTPDLLPYHTR